MYWKVYCGNVQDWEYVGTHWADSPAGAAAQVRECLIRRDQVGERPFLKVVLPWENVKEVGVGKIFPVPNFGSTPPS